MFQLDTDQKKSSKHQKWFIFLIFFITLSLSFLVNFYSKATRYTYKYATYTNYGSTPTMQVRQLRQLS